MQPVLIKKINDKYKMSDGSVLKMPVVAGQVLVKGDGEDTVSLKQIKNVLFCHCNLHVHDAVVAP